MRRALLAPPVADWPVTVVRCGGAAQQTRAQTLKATGEAAGYSAALCTHEDSSMAPGRGELLLARIRAEELFWPAPKARAARPRALVLGARWLAAARLRYADADILLSADPADATPDVIEAVFGPNDAPAALWATMGGLTTVAGVDPEAELKAAAGVSPWGGAALSLEEAVEAQALLRRAAMRARGPVGLVAMSPWKRRCLRPFLTGPDGPPRRAASVAQARARGLAPAVWGAGPPEPGVLRVEDGFLRSVGLGLRHAPPLSLVICEGAPHFDATRANGFDALAASADLTPGLLARAAQVRAAVCATGMTKYNLPGSEALPAAAGRLALLVAGQVESDASIRLGAMAVRTNRALLAAARARFPDAFLLYKPHPDVVTGLRSGMVPDAEALRFADALAGSASTQACLAWADRVASITSLIGFEALLRGKAVTVFGRPFYAGWGLTDDANPPLRPRALSLDELAAIALVLYPEYIDPESGLPAPVETALAALIRERAHAGGPSERLRRLWRDAMSFALNQF